MVLQEIKKALIKDNIHYTDAYEKIKMLPKVWARKEWKINRSRFIKNYCENCNCKTPPFVIQHFKHPTPFKDVYNQVMKLLYVEEFNKIKEKKQNINIEKYLNDFSTKRKGCPICKTITLRHRKNITPHFVCSKGHKFNTPVEVIYYTTCKTTIKEDALLKAKLFLSNQILNNTITELKARYDREIGRIALLESMRQSEIYLSMVYTKTYCKSCAFKEDYHKILLKNITLFLKTID